MDNLTLDERIWQMVASIPQGRVASYGQIASLCGYPRHARYVGRVLKQLPKDSRLPWFRVITASGHLAFAEGFSAFERQLLHLEAEGVVVVNGRVSIKHYGWNLD